MLTTAVMTSPFANLKACILSMSYLDFVVKFYVVVRPSAPVGADHIPSVAQRTEVELVRFRNHDVLVADPHCDPV